MEENGSKGAGDSTLLARNTPLLINLKKSIPADNSIGRAIFPAFGVLALPAYHRHPDDRVGVDYHYPNTALLGIINTKAVDRTHHFAQFTA